jgi:carbonic anhydrase
VEANVRWSMRQVLEVPEANARAAEGVMKLVGAVYELESGRVRFLRRRGAAAEANHSDQESVWREHPNRVCRPRTG